MGTGQMWLLLALCFAGFGATIATNFYDTFQVLFGPDHTSITQNGSQVALSLDRKSGSGFISKVPYLFGYMAMNIKLVPNDSAGTVTSYYVASNYTNWGELDFEFLGNLSGEPYIVQTNVFAEGVGQREQRVYLWFNPYEDYHSYGFLWNLDLITFFVDNVTIRVFHNCKDLGVNYLDYQPMSMFASIWSGDSWATQGGRVKTNWTLAPFTASYNKFNVQACAVPVHNQDNQHKCYAQLWSSWYASSASKSFNQTQIDDLRRVRQQYLIYDYCTDTNRYPIPPAECARNWP